MKTWLVTGGAGFIGGNFVHAARGQGRARVVNLDALTYAGHPETLRPLSGDPDHLFVHGDIGDRALVARLLAEHRPSAVVHFAAESHVDRSIDGPAAFVQTNVLGTLALLEAVLDYWNTLGGAKRDAFRFLHISTDEVYGALGATGAFTEDSPYRPNSPYAASKAAADHLVRAFHRTHGLPALTSNCSNNYGPYQYPEKLIPLMILKGLAGEPLPVYGDGQQVRDWLYVGDHCSALFRVLEAAEPGSVHVIGGNCERANLDLVRTLCRVLDDRHPEGAPHDRLITFVEDRPGHDRRYAIDARRMREELGWEPSVDLAAGLERTVAWYLDHRDWCAAVLGERYQGERLGLQRGA
ncbi:MAG: dTDP-glucose 4,6-dehydratase [Thermoanaerobaculia bacterium]